VDETNHEKKSKKKTVSTEAATEPVGLSDLLSMMGQNLSVEDIDFQKEMGGDEALPEPDVDISLHSSREKPVAGELWSISGSISNRSTKPIWIVDGATTLSLAPEMYGQSSQTGSIGAFFPTVKSRPFAETMRIDPGATYSVVWKIDPLSSADQVGSKQPIYKRIANSIRNYLFFNPGKFRVSSTTHIWSIKPQFNDSGYVDNYGSSFVKTISSEIEMDSSPWVLICGAAIGGVLCFIIQMLFGTIDAGGTIFSIFKSIAVGLTSAIILCGVVTVLLSRLATTDFILVVKIKDVWGAIATGFAIQWFGFPVLERILSSIS